MCSTMTSYSPQTSMESPWRVFQVRPPLTSAPPLFLPGARNRTFSLVIFFFFPLPPRFLFQSPLQGERPPIGLLQRPRTAPVPRTLDFFTRFFGRFLRGRGFLILAACNLRPLRSSEILPKTPGPLPDFFVSTKKTSSSVRILRIALHCDCFEAGSLFVLGSLPWFPKSVGRPSISRPASIFLRFAFFSFPPLNRRLRVEAETVLGSTCAGLLKRPDSFLPLLLLSWFFPEMSPPQAPFFSVVRLITRNSFPTEPAAYFDPFFPCETCISALDRCPLLTFSLRGAPFCYEWLIFWRQRQKVKTFFMLAARRFFSAGPRLPPPL